MLYSERFVVAGEGAGWTTYYVPNGKRAVVRAIDVANPYGLASSVDVWAGPGALWTFELPANRTSYHQETRAVVYQGEPISAMNQIAQVWVQVAGYLFDDAPGAQAPPTVVLDDPPWLTSM